MPAFTPTPGRYLACIHAYTCLHGYPPAESDIANALCVSPPAVNTMARQLDDLDLKPERLFGYLFHFGDEWYHQVEVERIEKAIPTVTSPRLIKRLGQSPPQYTDE